jgi:hypothetical protein
VTLAEDYPKLQAKPHMRPNAMARKAKAAIWLREDHREGLEKVLVAQRSQSLHRQWQLREIARPGIDR